MIQRYIKVMSRAVDKHQVRQDLELHGYKTWNTHQTRLQLFAMVIYLSHRLKPEDPYAAYRVALEQCSRFSPWLRATR